MIAAGAYLVLRSIQAARQVSLEHPDRLVTTGHFAVSRNPMYLGWALLHVGVGVATDSGWAVAVLPAVVIRVHREVLREEGRLARAFGDEFGAYRSRVPRYVAERWPG